MLKIMIGISIVLLVLTSVGILMTVNRVMQPLSVMMEEMKFLAQGDFRDRPAEIKSQDELGILASAIMEMRRGIANVMRDVNSSAESLSASAEELNATTEQSSLAANQVAQSIVKVAEGTNQQLDAVNETSQAIERLNEAIQSMASDSAKAALKSREASEIATEGGKTLETAIENLTANAFRHSPENGKICITLCKNKIIFVNDIEKRVDTTELLMPFVKGDKSRSGQNGNGLGLSIAKEASAVNGLTLEISCTDTEFTAILKK